jgi:hypothetical protein
MSYKLLKQIFQLKNCQVYLNSYEDGQCEISIKQKDEETLINFKTRSEMREFIDILKNSPFIFSDMNK